MTEKKVSKRFSAVLDNLHPMMAFISGQSRENGFDEEATQQILLASEEALVNVVSYAYPSEESGDLEIACMSHGKGHMGLVFRDHGLAFNPLNEVKEVDINASIDQREIGGLGVFIIKNTMEDVRYERIDGSNVFSMTKRASL